MKQLITIFGICFLFTTCKKYPENTGLHLRRPEYRIDKNLHLKAYNVNGDDSLPLLNGAMKVDVSSYEWGFGNGEIHTLMGSFEYKFTSDKKNLIIDDAGYSISSAIYYPIFRSLSSEWRIQKLEEEKTKL